MPPLDPDPSDLGLASPALGPWFGPAPSETPADLSSLGSPQANLSVSISLAADQQWLAPAGGTVSYFVATDPRPPGLARLRAESGDPAFQDGRGVVLFRLLPEVELRLHALAPVLPAPDGTEIPGPDPSDPQPGDAATRPRVRWLAFAPASAGSPFDSLAGMGQILEDGFPADVDTDDKRAAYLGLTHDGSGSGLGNADGPVTALRRPAGDDAVILDNGTGAALSGQLWAFDHRGRPLDPGAVAAWWAYLADVWFDNLWASDDPDEQRTAAVDDARALHVVSAHEGPLSPEHRARLDPTGLTLVGGAQTLYTQDDADTAPGLALTGAPDPDDAPIPRMAALPHGTYGDPADVGGSLLQQWDQDWPDGLSRDFARIAFLDVEQHLVGLDRSDPSQADARTRIEARRNSAAEPFATRIDGGTDEIMRILSDGTDAVVMAPVMDRDWGALDEQDFGTGAPPERLAYEVRALAGEGSTSSGTVSDQRVVVILESDSSNDPLPQDAWVRIWPSGLDLSSGRRFRQDGGGGRVASDGVAHVVVALPDGAADPTADMRFDALVVAGGSARIYTEQRFDRPATVAGSPVQINDPSAGDLPSGFSVRVCETGQQLAPGTGQVGSGQTLIAIPDDPTSDEYALVDPSSLEDADFDPDTLLRSGGGGDTLIVTEPAFQSTPEGDVTADPGPGGSTVVHRERDGLSQLDTMGTPVPTMERRELAAGDEGDESGVVGGAPGRSDAHEAAPSQAGHPGMPAAPEIHGVAASLAGPAVVPLIELLRERAAEDLLDFVTSAQVPVDEPAEPAGPTGWAAVLETLTFGVAGDAAMRAFADTGFTPGEAWLDLKQDIESATGQDLDSVIDSATFDDDALARALDRVLLKTRDGAFQVARALQAAVDRAEDFLFVETPALDALSTTSDTVELLDRVTTRLGERPGLVVLVACPERFLPDQPERLDEIRSAAISGALDALVAAAPDRVALFTPTAGSGRRLHMATTTVVVDDAFALTGSTHLWRRGLTFDASLAVAAFDESLTDGRPASVRGLRRSLLADRLGVAPELVPDDPHEVLSAVRATIEAGGLGRVRPDVFPARPDSTADGSQDAWNPDGAEDGTSDWLLFFNNLTGNVATDVSNAVRP